MPGVKKVKGVQEPKGEQRHPGSPVRNTNRAGFPIFIGKHEAVGGHRVNEKQQYI